MTFLQVQYVSHISTSTRSSGDPAIALAVTALVAMVIAAFLLIRDWRPTEGRTTKTLMREIERWMRDQPE